MQTPPPPTDQTEAEAEAEAAIPIDPMSNEDTNINRTVILSRKAAKRTLPWDLEAGELDLVSSPSPQAEDIPAARKKRRLEEPLPEATDEAASPDISVGLPPPAADDDDADTDADAVPVKVTRAIRNWTLEEDAKLTSAASEPSKKKYGKEYKTDWDTVAALIPGRTTIQCLHRWLNALDPSIDRAGGRKGKWTEDEDTKLKDAVQTHGGKNWDAIAVLVPGRTRIQCWSRWHDALNPSISQASGRKGKWTEDEDSKLKDAEQTRGGKNWDAIAVLVPGRTRIQCRDR
jgi:hypothetical protein